MKFTNLFFYTLRETPGEAEIVSHQLMLRAGLIRRLASGIYTYLPLGYRALKKVENIVREEMNRAGAQELLMPAMQPVELWEESGRLDVYVAENILFRVNDRIGRTFALGPTHEEVVCETARAMLNSYRDLPFNLYQIQTKFRDEIRPRFGLMRGKEFIMKDAYSFDIDMDGMNVSYQAMYDAYTRIFKRCGLKARPVEADSGAIGGAVSHEFMILAESGEDTVVSCDSCDYAANMEKAEVGGDAGELDASVEMLPMEEVDTPNVRTIEELAEFFKVGKDAFVKTLIYKADDKPVAVILRGDHTLNEIKLKNALGVSEVELADDATIEKVTGAPVGFAGPQGLDKKIDIVMDKSVVPMSNFISGGNKVDVHIKNINRGRDFEAKLTADLREAEQGDQCPRCEAGKLELRRGVEVGHVFKLGTKYSKKMNVVYTDENGNEHPAVMGCYGIGVGRTLAAVVEEHHDDNGIIFPVAVAPFEVYVTAISLKDDAQVKAAEDVYNSLIEAGVEAVLDDREERPGVKFKDADLMGFPVKIVAGRAVKDGQLELQVRREGEKNLVPIDGIAETVKKLLGEII